MIDDAQLLRHYVETRSEEAFAELVQRHLGLVYQSAVRQLGSEAHLAGDVAQAAFLLLARKARELVGHGSVAGWLHATTRFKVAEALRAERRRRVRETAAREREDSVNGGDPAPDWERLRPVIDDVLLELNPSDREAVLLRFFEQRPFADIAARLRLSEGAAHKRIERALDKLRERLARRGLTSTAAALSAVLGANVALAAPAGLATAVTGTVVASGLPLGVAGGVISFMSTKTVTSVAVAVVLLAGGTATQQVNAARLAREQLASAEREIVALRTTLAAASARAMPVARGAATSATTPTASLSPATRAIGSGGFASVEESRAFLRENPDVREAFARYLRLSLGHRYAELIARLGLSEEQTTRFLDVLALGRRQAVGEHQLTLSERDFQRGEFGQKLREVLGEAGYRDFREFEDKSGLRGMTYQLTRSLYATSTPLTPAQADRVQEIVGQALADPTLGPPATSSSWTSIPAERWPRILSDAAQVLNESQVEALRELEQQARFSRAMSAAAQAYRKSRDAGKDPK